MSSRVLSMTRTVFTLTLVRHGETAHNKSHIIQGQLDVPLSETGIEQAKLLGAHFQHEHFTHVYASDLSRAKQTAEEIVKANKLDKIGIICDPQLRERKFGELQGKEFSVLKKCAQEAGTSVFGYCPSGGETLRELRQRCQSFFKSLCENIHTSPQTQSLASQTDLQVKSSNSSNKLDDIKANVIVVSHGGFILELMRHFSEDLLWKIPGKQSEVLRISPNAGLSKFRIDIDQNGELKGISSLYVHSKDYLSESGAVVDNTCNIDLSL